MALMLCGLGGLLTLAFLATGSEALLGLSLLLVGVLCVTAQVAGIRMHIVAGRLPWVLITLAASCFLAGAVARGAMPTTGAASYPPDVLSLIGYGLLSTTLILWLSRGGRRASTDGRQGRADVLDAVTVGFGAGLVAWVLVVVPILGESTSALRQVLNATYPTLDIVLLTLCVRMTLTRSTRFPAFWFLVTGLMAILVADVVFAAADAVQTAPPLLGSAPYLFAFGAFGSASLHPSTRRLAGGTVGGDQGWGRGRLVGVATALFAPVLLAAAVPAVGLLDRVVRLVLAGAITAVVLQRTVQAINGYARSEQRARRQALRDSLTGLANRVALQEQLRDELPRAASVGESLAVLFLDLDGFKLVNDSYGHAVGDELLKAAAARIVENVRADDFVARIGGDEFVAIGRHADLATTEGLAARLLAAFDLPFPLSVGPMFVSTSIGITRFNPADPHADAESLIREADTAMYQAKSGGRHRAVLFDASLREQVRARIETENGLRRALARDEFRLHYQPIVALPGGQILGYESLLRWQPPDREMVRPDRFIPIAEESWLIVPIGRWVLQQALRDLARWHAEGSTHLYVSVNVSARQLLDDGFVADVVSALDAAGLPGSAVCLELTESALVVNPDDVQASLTALRTLGIAVAVDDFGTGYSALSYLRRFPVTQVKVDRSFVKDLSRPDDQALVRAIIAMAEALGLTVVAEGVETPEQEEVLLRLGCRIGQGYLYGRPEPRPAVDGLVEFSGS
jgi:diguanylate cyclase (GGDEF)-like protein